MRNFVTREIYLVSFLKNIKLHDRNKIQSSID